MKKDLLMRRISAATDLKKPTQSANKAPTPRFDSSVAPQARPQPDGNNHQHPQSGHVNHPAPDFVTTETPRGEARSTPTGGMTATPPQAGQQTRPPVAPQATSHLPPLATSQVTPPAPRPAETRAHVTAAQTPPIALQSAVPHGQNAASDPADPFPELGELSPFYDSPVGDNVNNEPVVNEDEVLIFTPQPKDEKKTSIPSEKRMKREDRPEAHVIACDGNKAIVQGDTNCVDTITGLTWAVGRMLTLLVGNARIVGMICDISMPDGHFSKDEHSFLHFALELQGEVRDGDDGKGPTFSKGIASYPGVGSIAHQIRAEDLAAIYAADGTNNGVIGNLSQDDSIPALVNVNDMLSKHFAVLGSTGCGKSASVSLLLHCAQELVPDLRTIILDPHNEYSRAFPNSNTVEQSTLDLPFWMFHLEEYAEVLFRGKPIIHEEIDALREFIPLAKTRFSEGEDRVILRQSNSSKSPTADTPVPYRVADLLGLIDDEMGLLESRYSKSVLKSLKARIVSQANDVRYAFMFRHKTIEDIAQKVVSYFFCLPGNGEYTTIIQMAGMPAEVVNSVASVLCRLSFELAIAAKGHLKILVVCEEAHRYVPAGKGGFEPTRRAIARIAKEGRKYGSFMAIISQRPSELDPTILSQCSTVFSLRLTNDYDQEIIKRAISSSSASTIAFISSLSNRECIAFGEGMSTPMRLKFRNLPKNWLPGAEADVFGNSEPVVDERGSQSVFRNWRVGAA